MGARWRRHDSPGAAAKWPWVARGGRLNRVARRVLLPAAAVSMAMGLALLGYTGYQVWDPGARHAQGLLIGRLRQQWAQQPYASHRPIALVTGQPFAVLHIPAFGAKWRFAVVEGTAPAQLAKGPGHVTGTQLPGEPGNFAVAAHDITAGNAFLHLGSLRKGDGISVTTVNGTYRYRVLSERVVRDTDVSVLDPVPGRPRQHPVRQFITLITCTPVTLAATPWRIVVTGVLTGMTPAMSRDDEYQGLGGSVWPVTAEHWHWCRSGAHHGGWHSWTGHAGWWGGAFTDSRRIHTGGAVFTKFLRVWKLPLAG